MTKINFNIFPFHKEKQIKSPSTRKVDEGIVTNPESDLRNTPSAVYGKLCVHKVEKTGDCEAKKHNLSNYTGCLLGGAAGDALGAPVEFYRLDEIKSLYGERGITKPDFESGCAEVTDDTQMTIFTADGLLKSALKSFDEHKPANREIVHDSYMNWLLTQVRHTPPGDNFNGWVADIPELYSRRAPGNTCLGGLMTGDIGSIDKPLNASKGCGGVMRTAPAGLMYYKDAKTAFRTGVDCAAITHGSPDAYLPAGVHAAIIANVIQGKDLEEAVDNSIDILKTYKGHSGTLKLLKKAKEYAKSDIAPEKAIKDLGEGWHGHEAIAISVYCALKEPNDFKEALRLAVNHDGDSDSTGAITGNILGAYLGEDAIPSEWKRHLELSQELRQLSKDLFVPPIEIENAEKRYPQDI